MEATFTYSGSLEGLWSYPVKISGEKGEPGAPGQPGAQGPSGPGICFRGDYDSFKYYNGTPTYVDVVRYAGRYYKANVTSGTFQGVHPMNTSKWELMNSFEGVSRPPASLAGYQTNFAGVRRPPGLGCSPAIKIGS